MLCFFALNYFIKLSPTEPFAHVLSVLNSPPLGGFPFRFGEDSSDRTQEQ